MAKSMAAGQRVIACEMRYSTNPTTPAAPRISAAFSPEPKRLVML